MTSKITPQEYVLRFGKYKNQRACDVAEIYTVDADGNDKPVGLMYLEWLCEQDWFKHANILQQIIENAKSNMSEEADSEPEPQPEPKKKKDSKKTAKVTINAPDVSKVIDFQN